MSELLPATEAVNSATAGLDRMETHDLVNVLLREQQAAAALMNVSRSTFSRILAQARKTVAMALEEGAAIEIGGGDFRLVSDVPDDHSDSQEEELET